MEYEEFAAVYITLMRRLVTVCESITEIMAQPEPRSNQIEDLVQEFLALNEAFQIEALRMRKEPELLIGVDFAIREELENAQRRFRAGLAESLGRIEKWVTHASDDLNPLKILLEVARSPCTAQSGGAKIIDLRGRSEAV